MENSKAVNVDSKWGFNASSDEDTRFSKSLQELKDLRSQLQYAATYCEDSYLKSEGKKKTMDNTKEYICRALVTFVDHLGSVSANLEDQLPNTKQFEDTEARVNCLHQRLELCQQYTHNLSLSKLPWSNNSQRHHRRYVSLQNQDLEKPTDVLRGVDDSLVCKTPPNFKLDNLEKEVPLFLYTFAHKSSSAQLPVADITSIAKLRRSLSSGLRAPVTIRVRDLSVMSIPRNPPFHFEQETKKVGRNEKRRRSLQLPWRNSYGIRRGDTL